MIKLGLIGTPLKQSLSPIIHNTAFEVMGLDGHYELLETQPEDLIQRIKYLKAHDFKGFNVTIPLKVPMTLFLQEVDEIANTAGAVNTVKISDDKYFYGYNTDVYGFVNGIPASIRADLKRKKAVIFGTGGVSRAVAMGLSQIGIDEIVFYSTSLDKAKTVVDFLQGKFPNIKFKLLAYSENIDLWDAAIAVNATPLGTLGKYGGISPVPDEVMDSLDKQAIVYDLVYNPQETEFLKQAHNRDLRTVEGIEMLIHQGLKAFEIWTGKKPPIEKIRPEVLKHL